MSRTKMSKAVKGKGIVHPVEYVESGVLKASGYNPRKIEMAELEKLATNIARFGFVESVTARKETQEIIGGHQRVAALGLLMSGKFQPKDEEGEPLPYTPVEKIPVVYVEGLTDAQAKLLNLSLNRIHGDWDFDKLQSVLHDVHEVTLAEVQQDYEKTMAIMEMSGFNSIEIADYLELGKGENSGLAPKHLKGSPKLTLDFSSKESRDAFKSFLGGLAGEGNEKPSGDLLAEKLGVGAHKG